MLSTKPSETLTPNLEQSSKVSCRTKHSYKHTSLFPQQVFFESNNLLIEELQLKNKLCESVKQSRRADFSLMLAMLSDDVREFSQFYLPAEEKLKEKEKSNAMLRDFFELGDMQPLGLEFLSHIVAFNQAKLVEDGNFHTLRLINTLTPKPLVFRDNNKFISRDVLSNTRMVCQQKYNALLERSQHIKKSEGINETGDIMEKNLKSLALPVLNKEKRLEAVKWFKSIQNQRINNN